MNNRSEELFLERLVPWAKGEWCEETGDAYPDQDDIDSILCLWDRELPRTGSPIEALMLAEFMFLMYEHPFGRVTCLSGSEEPNIDGADIAFRCQEPVGRYRADFMFFVCFRGAVRLVAIECDGHDYHERTKEQARHDRSRDRYFAAQGIQVLRFTGSEIYRSPSDCAEEVSDFLSRHMFDLHEPHLRRN